MLIWCITLAGAAEVSWMPDALEGAATLRYAGLLERGGLEEQGTRISGRRTIEHRVLIGAELSPYRGIALNVAVSTVPAWAWGYSGARQMLLEPVEGGGSYLNAPTDPNADPGITGGGIEGVWIGGAVAPLSEAFSKNHKVTWRMDLAVRTASGQNRWTLKDGGKRGGGPGGSAVKLAGAFSKRSGPADGYIRAVWQREGKVVTDVVDEAGTTWATGLTVRPASRVELLGGTEVVTGDGTDVRVAFDVHAGFGYRTWEDIPSGLLLPNVLEASRGTAVTHSETVDGLLGMGFHLRFVDNVRVSLGGRFAYVLPHTQENVYAVRTTADTVGFGWTFALTGVLGRDDFVDPED